MKIKLHSLFIGLALLAGGYGLAGPTNSAELCDPATGIWAPTITPMNTARNRRASHPQPWPRGASALAGL